MAAIPCKQCADAFKEFLAGHGLCRLVLFAGAAVMRTSGLLALLGLVVKVGDNTRLDQDAVCLVQDHSQAGKHVAIEMLEQDEPLADLDVQVAAGLPEQVAQVFRGQGVDRVAAVAPGVQ